VKSSRVRVIDGMRPRIGLPTLAVGTSAALKLFGKLND
jgi:hypothetical protein